MKSGRGMAVPLLLFLLLALSALAHGALLLARQELRGAQAAKGVLGATQAAEGGILLALRELRPWEVERTPGGAHPLVEGEREEGQRFRGAVRWLDRELFLLEGAGRVRGWEGERRVARLGWSLHPAARLGAFRGVVEAGGELLVREGGAVVTDSLLPPPDPFAPPASRGPCRSHQALLDSLFPRGSLPARAPLVAPSPGQAHPPPLTGLPGLGLLTGARILSLASPVEGEKDAAQDPCASGPLLLGSAGSMALSSGRLCGLLVVDGSLRLEGTVHFRGLLLVAEELTLEGEARLEGMARAGGRVSVGGSARLVGSACPVLLSLAGIPELQEPFLLPGQPRLSLF